jgi:hypothetical protein
MSLKTTLETFVADGLPFELGLTVKGGKELLDLYNEVERLREAEGDNWNLRYSAILELLKHETELHEKTRAERDAMREDAERYRWLKMHADNEFVEHTIPVLVVPGANFSSAGWSGKIDEAIDAARNKK